MKKILLLSQIIVVLILFHQCKLTEPPYSKDPRCKPIPFVLEKKQKTATISWKKDSQESNGYIARFKSGKAIFSVFVENDRHELTITNTKKLKVLAVSPRDKSCPTETATEIDIDIIEIPIGSENPPEDICVPNRNNPHYSLADAVENINSFVNLSCFPNSSSFETYNYNIYRYSSVTSLPDFNNATPAITITYPNIANQKLQIDAVEQLRGFESPKEMKYYYILRNSTGSCCQN